MATTPVFWPGESHGQRSLEGFSLRGLQDNIFARLTTRETHEGLTQLLLRSPALSPVPLRPLAPLLPLLLGQEAVRFCWPLCLALSPGRVSEESASPGLSLLLNSCRPGLSWHLLHTASGCSLLQSDEEGGPDRGGEDGQQKFIAHVPVPSQQEVGRWARWALLWVPPVPAGSSDSRGAGDHVQFRVWVQGRRESIHLRAVACPAVHGGSLWLTCAWEEVSGEVDAAPAPPLLPADRGGARAQEEDGAATEVHQRDPAGPERGGPAALGLLGGPAAASPALLAHTMRPPGWAAGPLASPQPREPTRMCPEWEGQAGPAACKCRQWWGGQPGTPQSAQMCP